jgi:hypothetical protein
VAHFDEFRNLRSNIRLEVYAQQGEFVDDRKGVGSEYQTGASAACAVQESEMGVVAGGSGFGIVRGLFAG